MTHFVITVLLCVALAIFVTPFVLIHYFSAIRNDLAEIKDILDCFAIEASGGGTDDDPSRESQPAPCPPEEVAAAIALARLVA